MNAAHRYSEYYTGKMKKKKKSQLYFNLGFTLYEINYTAKNRVTHRTLSTAYILTVFMLYIQSVSNDHKQSNTAI